MKEDFTEDNYRRLLKIAKNNYKFIDILDYEKDFNYKTIIWKHDIDISVNRAYKLALIEASENIKASYFIHIHSNFYNVFEKPIYRLILKIKELGHYIGLHYEPTFYNIELGDSDKFEYWLLYEKELLEKFFDIKITSYTMHDANKGGWINLDEDRTLGLINCYSKYFKENYFYCSDSNGYWRYSRLEDVLVQAEHKKLNILTHPNWWPDTVLSPNDRIIRAIDGRSKNTYNEYCQFLEESGRINVKD